LKGEKVDNIPNLFWISVLVWLWSEISSLFRIATLRAISPEEKVEYRNDHFYIFYKRTSWIGLNLAGILGMVIISVSFFNILGG
jgi:hypothetical protein